MKTIKMALLIAMSLSALNFSNSAHAGEKKVCTVATTDIGTITGRGASTDLAFEDAATQCFERREKLFKLKKNNADLDEDTGLVMIDACANIKCGKS